MMQEATCETAYGRIHVLVLQGVKVGDDEPTDFTPLQEAFIDGVTEAFNLISPSTGPGNYWKAEAVRRYPY